MKLTVGIAGAGLAGRLFALACLKRGWQVTLFDQDNREGKQSCGWVGAGMLAPYSELETAEPLLFQLGLLGMSLWSNIVSEFTLPVSLQFNGTLVVAHPQDKAELKRFYNVIQHKLHFLKDTSDALSAIKPIASKALQSMAPAIFESIAEGYWIANEGHIDSNEFFSASTEFFCMNNVSWQENCKIHMIKPHEIHTKQSIHRFDLVCDTRGLGAKQN